MKSNLTAVHLNHTNDVLRELLRFDRPADVILSRYFRENKKLGQKDRHEIAELTFACLRHLERVKPFIEPDAVTARRVILVTLLKIFHYNLKEIPDLSSKEATWLSLVKGREVILTDAQLADLPEWVMSRLTQLDSASRVQLGQSLAQAAPLDLRVNSQKSKRDAVLEKLQAVGYPASATPYSPVGIRLAEKSPINKHGLYEAGVFEVQDEGSQLLSILLGAKRGEMVADFCAGAGGKTLHIGAMMASTGRLYAFDVSEKRLGNLKPRLARSGLSNVQPNLLSTENDPKVKRLAAKFDRVLVDSPCSGLGTLRRNPDLKYRQSPESLAELNVKQTAILASAARLVRRGGRLVYATCSILPEENEAIVQAFLAAHLDFTVLAVQGILDDAKIPLTMSTDFLQLYPHLHATDGFFAAVMVRRLGLTESGLHDMIETVD